MQRKRSSRGMQNLRAAGNGIFNLTGKFASKGYESTAHRISSNSQRTQEFINSTSDIASIERDFLLTVANSEFETRRMMRQIDYAYYFDETGRKPLLLIRLFDWVVDSLACVWIFILALILPFFTLLLLMLLRVVIIILCYAIAMGAFYLYFK